MTAINWKLFPFVRILPAFLTGLLLGQYIAVSIDLLILPFILILLTAFFVLIQINGLRRTTSLYLMLGVLLSALLLSASGPEAKMPLTNKLDYHGQATIIAPLTEKAKTYRTTIELSAPGKEEDKLRAITYIRKSLMTSKLLPGDRIQINTELSRMAEVDIPGQFDYAKYLNRKKICCSSFVDSTQWEPLPPGKSHWLNRRATLLRDHFETVIDLHVQQEYAGLIKAMVLGLKTALDPEMTASFSRSGIIHILAVSGLHVSIIWLIVSLVHRPLTKRYKQLVYPGIVIEIISVWSFAILTGFGPSVQRAAFMFTLLSFSKMSGMKGHIINITSGSAMILLIVRPTHLYEAGFQLSYAAVFGILLCYSRIRPLLYFKNRIVKYLWTLEVVSISAVIGTAPISIFYFQQFPLIFPLTNLIAIPAAFAIVTCTVILLVVQSFTPLASCLGFLLSKTAWLLTTSSQFFAELHWSAIKSIHIDRTEMFIIYFFILLSLLITYRLTWKPILAPYLLICLIVFFGYRGMVESAAYGEWKVYQNVESALIINCGKNQYVMHDDTAVKFHFPLSGNQKLDRIRRIDSIPMAAQMQRDLIRSIQNRED